MLLFVCSRNICRSAVAEAVFNYILQSSGRSPAAQSAGARADCPGEPADSLMRQVAARRGYDLSAHSSRAMDSLSPSDFSHAFWLDASQRDPLRRWASGADIAIAPLMRYSEYYATDEVLMPAAASAAHGYALMLDQVEDACLGLWHHLTKEGVF